MGERERHGQWGHQSHRQNRGGPRSRRELESGSGTRQRLCPARNYRPPFFSVLHAGGLSGGNSTNRSTRGHGNRKVRGRRLAGAQGWNRFWASVIINAIKGPDGQILGFAKVTRDLTERRAADERARQAQKMEGVGQLTGGVAHDFNNLLTIIIGNLETLQRNIRRPDLDIDRLERSVGNAMRGARRAESLTQRLLAFSRQQPLDPKPIDLGRLVTGMSDLLRRTLGEQITIETVLSGNVWRALADPNQLELAILNLAVNARDAMPSGGKLTLETANVHLDEKYASSQAEVVPGQYVMLAVTETAAG